MVYFVCKNKVKEVSLVKKIQESLLNEWDYERNTVAPETKSAGSQYKAWWTCPVCGHRYQATITNRTHGSGCPCCSGAVVIPGINDLKTKYPELCKEWDYEKNTIRPEEVSRASGIKVWWKCPDCGHSWKASVANRTRNSKCPACSRNRKKEVCQYSLNGEFIQTFESLSAAARAVCTTANNISFACHGHTKTSCGYFWQFAK